MNRPRIKDFEDKQEYLIQLNQYVNYLEETVQSERKQVLAMSEAIGRHCSLVENLIKNTQYVTERLVKNDNSAIVDILPEEKQHNPAIITTVATVLFVFLVLATIIAGIWKI